MDMTKEETLKKIEYLKLYIEEIDKKENRILVPKEIMFEGISGDGDSLGLIFDEHSMIYTKKNKLYISSSCDSYIITHGELELVKVNKPEAGNWYCVKDNERINLTAKRLYRKYISEKQSYYIDNNKNIIKSQESWKHYWQVKRVHK